ncbi:MAG: hypothetical protein J6A20_09275 [Muribaculaceae bacterium]|nr:hypothetical protein [Muribaculaceae bacterium]
MKKYFLTFCALLATALTFTSCLSTSNSENVYTATLGSAECFARVYDMETQETITTQGASYAFKFNFTDGTIQPEIANLQLAPNFGGLTFKLPPMTLVLDTKKGFYTCSGQNLTPVNAQSSYVFDKFSFKSIPNRAYNNLSQPVYCIDFTLNNRYQVSVYQKNNFYFGTTKAMAVDGSTNESNEDVAYNVSIDPNTNKAVLRVYNGKFAPTMGPETFGVKDLPVEFSRNGFLIRTDKAYSIYDTSNKDVEGWSMNDLIISAVNGTGANVSFKCVLGEKGSYVVNASLEYLIYKENNSTNKPQN